MKRKILYVGLIALALAGIAAWSLLSSRVLEVRSADSSIVARTRIPSWPLAGTDEQSAVISFHRTNTLIGQVMVHSGFFESPVTVVPLTNNDTFLLVYDNDIRLVLATIDTGRPPISFNFQDSSENYIFLKTSVCIREPTVAEIDAGIKWLSGLNRIGQWRAIYPALSMGKLGLFCHVHQLCEAIKQRRMDYEQLERFKEDREKLIKSLGG